MLMFQSKGKFTWEFCRWQ